MPEICAVGEFEPAYFQFPVVYSGLVSPEFFGVERPFDSRQRLEDDHP